MTMIYLLMRRHVDEVELDEVYLEEDQPDAPLAPPVSIPTPTPSAVNGTTSLPMVPPPPPPVSIPMPTTEVKPTDETK